MRKILALFMAVLVCVSVFSGCGGSDSPSEEPSDNPSANFDAESETSSESNGSETSSEEPDSVNPDDAITARYIGDWNGILKIYDCTGDYTSLEGVVTGACARIVPDENGELFIFLGLYLEGFYITSAYYDINYASESIFISGDYNVGSYENVEILEHTPGTIGMTFPVEQENGSFYFTVNLRRIGDENWTNENPGFGQADIDYFRGKTFEDIALMMGYSSNQYPSAELFNNVPSGSSSSALGEKTGADGIVSDYDTIKNALEFCRTERTYDTTYDEIASLFGVHGFHVDDFDASGRTMRRYRWFYDDDNRVTITFEVKPDGTETWNVTAWDGLED